MRGLNLIRLAYIATESVIILLTSCLTEQVVMLLIQNKQSSWIERSKTMGHLYTDTYPIKVSECSLFEPLIRTINTSDSIYDKEGLQFWSFQLSTVNISAYQIHTTRKSVKPNCVSFLLLCLWKFIQVLAST